MKGVVALWRVQAHISPQKQTPPPSKPNVAGRWAQVGLLVTCRYRPRACNLCAQCLLPVALLRASESPLLPQHSATMPQHGAKCKLLSKKRGHSGNVSRKCLVELGMLGLPNLAIMCMQVHCQCQAGRCHEYILLQTVETRDSYELRSRADTY